MSQRLAGKTAFLTAAGAGIGRATAIAFAREGARVIATDLKPELMDNLRGIPGIEIEKLDALDAAAIADAAVRHPDVDVLFNAAGGRNYFENCSFVHLTPSEPVVRWAAACDLWNDFTKCWLGGVVGLGGAALPGASARFIDCDGVDSTYSITSGNWTVRIENAFRIGQVEHTTGELIMHDVKEFTGSSANSITSTANVGGKNRLLLNTLNLRRPNGTYKPINKTGNCEFILNKIIRNGADVLNGQPVHLGSFSGDDASNVRVDGASTVTVLPMDDVVLLAAAGPRTATLPTGTAGKRLVIKDVAGTASTANITIIAPTDIDDASTAIIDVNYGYLEVVWGNGKWNVLRDKDSAGGPSQPTPTRFPLMVGGPLVFDLATRFKTNLSQFIIDNNYSLPPALWNINYGTLGDPAPAGLQPGDVTRWVGGFTRIEAVDGVRLISGKTRPLVNEEGLCINRMGGTAEITYIGDVLYTGDPTPTHTYMVTGDVGAFWPVPIGDPVLQGRGFIRNTTGAEAFTFRDWFYFDVDVPEQFDYDTNAGRAGRTWYVSVISPDITDFKVIWWSNDATPGTEVVAAGGTATFFPPSGTRCWFVVTAVDSTVSGSTRRPGAVSVGNDIAFTYRVEVVVNS
jgi:NAD(P)-dependent dehydrogenase (short-subunit alcohol dehydrogenase family)